MSPKSFLLNDIIASYLAAHNPALDAAELALIEATQELGSISGMQIAPEQGAFMTFLTRILNVTYAVEVGTFTGYSALCLARGLGAGGHMLCCDVSEEWTAIALQAWRAAGVDHLIELKLAPAIDTLRRLPQVPHIDLAFIDADKTSYQDYYEELLPRLTERGVILVDNVLWSGRVADPSNDETDTAALRDFNDHVAADPRSDSVMLPVADGLTLIQQRH